jgi:hypothetical protein
MFCSVSQVSRRLAEVRVGKYPLPIRICPLVVLLTHYFALLDNFQNDYLRKEDIRQIVFELFSVIHGRPLKHFASSSFLRDLASKCYDLPLSFSPAEWDEVLPNFLSIIFGSNKMGSEAIEEWRWITEDPEFQSLWSVVAA